MKRSNELKQSTLIALTTGGPNAHLVARALRQITVVFWPEGAQFSTDKQWTRHMPELSDAEMVAAAAAGQKGTAWIYRNHSDVNTMRDTPSAEITV